MLIQAKILKGIRAGKVTLAFRRWRRPTVKTGGSLRTLAGELEIKRVEPVGSRAITEKEARAAGYSSLAELKTALEQRPEGALYRIRFGRLRADPRFKLRQSSLDDKQFQELQTRLRRMDARASSPWTARTLALIARHPAERAGDLCARAKQPKEHFKTNVRKLKNLGLTESLGTGYRLSKRGEGLLARLV